MPDCVVMLICCPTFLCLDFDHDSLTIAKLQLYDAAGNYLNLPTLVADEGSLATLTKAILTDGPMCGGGSNQFDADLLRVRKVRVSVAGGPVDLTPTEFQLLLALIREPGRVFTRGQLLDAVHGVAIESYERAIDAHVKNIRKKIEPTSGRPTHILTVHGVRYRFADA